MKRIHFDDAATLINFAGSQASDSTRGVGSLRAAFMLPGMDASSALSPEVYAEWFNDQVRGELRRLRLALGKTAYALALPGRLTAQTISNIESGKHSPSLRTLCLYCRQLHTTVEVVILAVGRD